MSKKFTVITGASGGIGRALAFACADVGRNLVLTARNASALAALCAEIITRHGVEARFLPLDLVDADAARRLLTYCVDEDLAVDMLINNAGCGFFGLFDELSLDAQVSMINLNVTALVRLCHGFLPLLKKQERSYLLNVASVAALYPLPYYSAYSATKAFVHSFTKALAFETRNTPVSVCCLLPGDTDTDFFRRAGNERVRKGTMSPRSVADFALEGLFAGKTELFTPNIARLRRVPRSLLESIIKKRMAGYMARTP